MNQLLEPLLNDTRLPQLLEEMQAYWEGEQLRRNAFYETITPNDKAEFILGKAVMHSPVSLAHNMVLLSLLQIMRPYVQRHLSGSVLGFEKLMIRLTRNDFEPDLCYWSAAKARQFSKNQMLFPAPDFVVEVLSKSTEKNDRGIKMTDYAMHGVQEYWLIDPVTETVEQYLLKQGVFELEQKTNSGRITCQVLEGLVLPVEAIFDENLLQHYLNTTQGQTSDSSPQNPES